MVTYVVPSVGRPCLQEALDSIETWPGDEILVLGDMGHAVDPRVRFIPCAPGLDWGHSERNLSRDLVRGTHIANLDDDDTVAPGTRAVLADAMLKTPARPVIFRMRYPNGFTLWTTPGARSGNVGTPMMFMPNDPDKLGTWGSGYCGDFHFLSTCRWAAEDYVWRAEVVALIGRNQDV